MAPHVLCECCQHDVAVETPIPQVGDVVTCACGAQLRLTRVDFIPELAAELLRPPPGFDDDELTPVETPHPHPFRDLP